MPDRPISDRPIPERLAVQLYTLRHLSDDPRELVRVAAAAGYTGVEGGYGGNVAADALREALDAHGVAMVSAHVALDALEGEFDAVLAEQRTLGNDTLAIPWIDADLRPADAAGWRALGERFGALAERCRAEGFRLLYHHHDFELVDVEGALALEHMLDAAPELGLELDVGWCQVAGVDPLRLIERYADRLPRLHVKDRAPAGENADEDGWADVGHGVIDWPPVVAAAERAGVEWFVVEHDAPADPVRTIRRSIATLRGL